MDHSLRSYLNRQSDETLKIALRDCLKHDSEHYTDIANLILEILENRILGSDSPSAKENT